MDYSEFLAAYITLLAVVAFITAGIIVKIKKVLDGISNKKPRLKPIVLAVSFNRFLSRLDESDASKVRKIRKILVFGLVLYLVTILGYVWVIYVNLNG